MEAPLAALHDALAKFSTLGTDKDAALLRRVLHAAAGRLARTQLQAAQDQSCSSQECVGPRVSEQAAVVQGKLLQWKVPSICDLLGVSMWVWCFKGKWLELSCLTTQSIAAVPAKGQSHL